MRNRLVVIVATGVTLLLAGGTGLALASTPQPAPQAAATSTGTAPDPVFVAPAGTGPAALPPAAPAEGPGITAEEAESIALARVGAGRVTEIEREFEHGRLEWKVEIVEGPREHDVRIDATTGVVIRTTVDDRD